LRLEGEPRAALGPTIPLSAGQRKIGPPSAGSPQAGDIVISGGRPDGAPLTFAYENGTHGGPGREETRALRSDTERTGHAV